MPSLMTTPSIIPQFQGANEVREEENAYIRRLVPISIRKFAAFHGLPYETWRRELKRGATGPIVRKNGR